MPCITEEPSDRVLNEQYHDISGNQAKALLCGLLTHVGHEVFCHLDWDEIGFPESVALNWWTKHQERDRLRRKAESMVKKAAKNARRKQYEELRKEFGDE